MRGHGEVCLWRVPKPVGSLPEGHEDHSGANFVGSLPEGHEDHFVFTMDVLK